MTNTILTKLADERVIKAVEQEANDQKEWIRERVLSGASRIAKAYGDEEVPEEELVPFLENKIFEILKEIL